METTQLHNVNPSELREMIQSAVRQEMRTQPKRETKPDRITDIDEICEITGRSKPWVYKQTSSGNLPCARFGSRLIFSRQKVENWMQGQTRQKKSVNDRAAEELQATAKKKTAS